MSPARRASALPGDRLIVGLGNPGPRYRGSRHNVGFAVVDELARRVCASFRTTGRLRTASAPIAGGRLTLAKPQTYMNLSGDGVAPWVGARRFPLSAILVVHDDLDLPAGRLRFRRSGTAGGHRGVQSIIDALGSSDFARLKIGIGRPPAGVDPVDYVLRRPAGDELALLAEAVALACQACEAWIAGGIEKAMNLYNFDPAHPPGAAGADSGRGKQP